MTAAAGDWFAVPRRGRVEEAVGALGAVRGAGAARDRRRGMIACSGWERPQAGISGRKRRGGSRRRQIARLYRWLRAGVWKRVAQEWWW
jgi:hypothetical protein